jgi:pimeloyl-ACP methyl ester carboxylesterase
VQLVWPDFIIQPLRDAGYQVIRYDHRGVGMSDWIAHWDKDNPYTLEDMAADAVAVLDAVGVEKAHIVGVSMGGMIGQRMAISHADRVLSLTSISSSGYLEDPALAPKDKPSNLNLLRLLIKYGLWRSERNTIKLSVGFIQQVMGDDGADLEIKPIAEQILHEMRNWRGFNPRIWEQHVGAIFASGSRYDELGTIRVPTLIIHGTADIAIPLSHGQRCAELIPGAKTLWLEGVGHILPRSHAETVINAILATIDNEKGKALTP